MICIWIGVMSNAIPLTQPTARFLRHRLSPSPCLTLFPQLGDLVRELCAAFEAEKALGHAINNRQDPQSANRLNGRVQALLQVGNARTQLLM